MRIRQAAVPLVLLSTTLSSRAQAQGHDSTTFRRGEWGADFQIAGGFAGAGAFRFSSPTQAWLVDLETSLSHSSNTSPGFAGSANSVDLSLKLGRRRYATQAHSVAPWIAFGLTFAYSWHDLVTNDTVTARGRGIGGGVFGALGATWFVTPHLGVGAQWGLNVTYTHTTYNGGSGSSSSNAIQATLPNMALVGQLYF